MRTSVIVGKFSNRTKFSKLTKKYKKKEDLAKPNPLFWRLR